MQCNWERQVLSDFIQKLSMELFTDVELDFDFSTAPPRWLLCVVHHMRCTASPSYTARVQGRFQCRAIKLSPSSRHKSQYGHCKGALCMHHPLNKPVILLYHGLHLALASHKILKKRHCLWKRERESLVCGWITMSFVGGLHERRSLKDQTIQKVLPVS